MSEFFMISTSPFISGLFWFLLAVIALYLARTPAHYSIRSLTRAIHNAMRLSARSVRETEKRLLQRNKEVLLAQGREASERIIEREFERIEATVRRDLAEYPAIHRQLHAEINQIDEDYQNSTEVPPNPPGWVKAVEAVAKLPSKGDPMVANILEDIHGSLKKANDKTIKEYRQSSQARHQHLKNMMPRWRKVSTMLGQVDKNINSLFDRSVTIDRHMDEYEQILGRNDRAERMLSSSSLTQFFIAAFVLAIAVGGALINFHLIARPLSEMVGGTSHIMGLQINNIAAMVIILVEIAMGLFLMEAMRITRLFPIIGALNDKVRRRMAWVFFTILTFLACIEASLAFMRELLMEEDAATRAILRGEEGASVIQGSYLWITTAAQMGMGFVLPYALMFVAIPLESFVHSLRTVMGLTGLWLLRTLEWALRLGGDIMKFMGNALIHIYDFTIFAPLWIENMLKQRNAKAEQVKPAGSGF
jgi:hypothetical protein